jgi:hypothetical protein
MPEGTFANSGYVKLHIFRAVILWRSLISMAQRAKQVLRRLYFRDDPGHRECPLCAPLLLLPQIQN